MSVSSYENYFLKGILKRLLHSRSAHYTKGEKKSKVPNTLSSLFRAESLYATKKYLGKDAGSPRGAHSKGFKGIMCTLVSVKECMALSSIACYQTYCPTRYAAQFFSEPFGGFSAGLFAHVCQHC